MSLSVAGMLEGGKAPATEAALVKDLGTIFQQELPEIARILVESEATDEADLADFLETAQYASMIAPAYTLQGGTYDAAITHGPASSGRNRTTEPMNSDRPSRSSLPSRG